MTIVCNAQISSQAGAQISNRLQVTDFLPNCFFFFQGLNIHVQTWNSLMHFQILEGVLCNNFTIFTVVACVPPRVAALISCFHSNDEVKERWSGNYFITYIDTSVGLVP